MHVSIQNYDSSHGKRRNAQYNTQDGAEDGDHYNQQRHSSQQRSSSNKRNGPNQKGGPNDGA